MQIYTNLLRVLFVLSTIVFMTDCCSSKFMLLKEHIAYDKQQQQQQPNLDLQNNMQLPDQLDTIVSLSSEIQFIPNHLEATTEINFGKIANLSGTKINETILPYEDVDYNDQDEMILFSTLVQMFTTVPTTIITDIDSNDTQDTSTERDDHNLDTVPDVLSLECYGEHRTGFCLNRGRCFRYLMGNDSLFSCECADGFVGERCESKSLNGYYVPHRGKRSTNRILTARVFFSFPILIVISLFHVIIGLLVILKNSKTYYHQQRSLNHNSVTFNRHHLTGNDAATVTAVIG